MYLLGNSRTVDAQLLYITYMHSRLSQLTGSEVNTTLGVQQMLMHRKTCLIPIVKHII